MPAFDPAAVRARAHEIWLKKGKREGHAIADWVQAEKELAAEAAAKPAPSPVLLLDPRKTDAKEIVERLKALKPPAAGTTPAAVPPPPKPPALKPPSFPDRRGGQGKGKRR